MTDLRIVPCECCGTEGRIYVSDWYVDNDGHWMQGERDTGPCEECEGTGGAIVAVRPVTLEDIEAMPS